jgi:hypothetical protein
VGHEVTRNGGDSEEGIGLRIGKVIVPYVLVCCGTLEDVRQRRAEWINIRTFVYCPPDKMPVIDLAIEGFSATQRTLIIK